MEFVTKVENVNGNNDLLTLDPRGGIQFMDCEGEEQVWVVDCDSMNEIYADIVTYIANQRNLSQKDAKEIFEAISVDFALFGMPVEEYNEELTPNDFTKMVTKAEYVKSFYEDLELEQYFDLPEYK